MDQVGLMTVEVVDDRVMVFGELDTFGAAKLREHLIELGIVAGTAIDLDLSEVTFIDSGGLHALTYLRQSFVMLRVVAMSTRVEQLLALTGLTDIVFGADRDDMGS